MSKQHVVLTDVANGVWIDEYAMAATDGFSLDGSDKWSVSKRTLKGGSADGVDVVTVDNGVLSMDIVPTRGMGLWRGFCRDLPIGWNSPVKFPVHPRTVNLKERGGLGWLAGFNELLCRCGLAFNGPPGTDVVIDADGNRIESELTLHGRIANTPAHYVAVEVATTHGGLMTVTGEIDEAMMFGPALSLKSTVSTVAGSSRLTVADAITNRGGQTAELQLLYHTNVGEPFLQEAGQFVAPIRQVAPRDARAAEDANRFATYAGPVAGYAEQVYYFELIPDESGQTITMLRNAAGDNGVTLRFSPQQLPCFALWKNTADKSDGYVTGMEPATNFPNLKTFERQNGRVIRLEPGQTYESKLELSVQTSTDDVATVEREVAEIQSKTVSTVHLTPIPEWSPVG